MKILVLLFLALAALVATAAFFFFPSGAGGADDASDGNLLLESLRRDNVKSDPYENFVMTPFAQAHCNLSGVDQWMVPPDDWRRRAPYFLILGEKKSGTTGLFTTLNLHPQVVRAKRKELIFFNPEWFLPYWSNRTIGGGVNVADAREALFKWFPHPALRAPNSTLITLEGTPEYLLFPDISSTAILCTIPWVKVVVILRDPVDRLFSHYNFLRDPTKHNATLPPFERMMQRDIVSLRQQGVLPQNLSHIPQFMGTDAERQAHLKYQYTKNGERFIIRGMYRLQVEGWIRALRRFGKDPNRDFRIVISEQLKSNHNVANDLLEWLGLPRLPAGEIQPKKAMVTQYTSDPISPPFRRHLEYIYRPYTARLFEMLRNQPDLKDILIDGTAHGYWPA